MKKNEKKTPWGTQYSLSISKKYIFFQFVFLKKFQANPRILEGFFKNPRKTKNPPEWQPCGSQVQNIAYVSAFIDPYPHMIFQVNILSSSKVTEGDGPMDQQTNGQTDRRTDGPTLLFI